MALEPFVRLLPNAGRVGATVELLGQGFQGTTSVAFDGIPATSFHVVSDAYMTAVVPDGAKTGTVTVTTPGGILKSNTTYRIIK